MEVSCNISYSGGSVPPTIGLTAYQLLEKRARDNPDHEMYVFVADEERITFKGFKERIERLAAGLLAVGLQKGDRLAIWGNNHFEFPVFVAASRAIGVINVRIPPGFPQAMVINTLRRTSCKAIVLARSPCDLYDKISEVIMSTKNSATTSKVIIPSIDIVIGVGDNNKRGTYSIETIEELGSDPRYSKMFQCISSGVKFDDISDIFPTSGSTGMSKLVVHTQFSIINGTKTYLDYLIDAPDIENRRMLVLGSMTHISGEVVGILPPLVAGITMVSPSPVYDRSTTLQTIQDERCTNGAFLINMLYDFVNHQEANQFDLTSLRECHCGGSNIPPKLLSDLEIKYNIKAMVLYASTEMVVATSTQPSDSIQARSTTGRALASVELQVVDDDGKCLPVGSIGEVWCRCPGMFQGYWEDEKKTTDVMTPQGWYKSGDIGSLDSAGLLTLAGRKQDMIIKAGLNIIPGNVENILSQHPSIEKVQVIGVPDDRLGEEVCVCVRPRQNTSIDKDQIVQYLTGKVVDNTLPGYVIVFENFPTTESGKIDRLSLQQQAVEQVKLL